MFSVFPEISINFIINALEVFATLAIVNLMTVSSQYQSKEFGGNNNYGLHT